MRAFVHLTFPVLDTPPLVVVNVHLWDGQNPVTEVGANTNQWPETKIAYDDNENDIRRKIVDVAVRLTGLAKHDIVLVN